MWTDVCLNLLVQERFTKSPGALCWGCAALVLGRLVLAPSEMFSAESDACSWLCLPMGAWEELVVLFVLTFTWLKACVPVTVLIILRGNLVVSVTVNMPFNCTCFSLPFPVNLRHLYNALV